jgi:EAL domain-containing protein (putative c-di-GMP-specific phosphodiesterase class I)
VKVDIEFVRDLVTNSANQHVVKAIVNPARGFGCQTIAEGVEDEDMLRLLRSSAWTSLKAFRVAQPVSEYRLGCERECRIR